MSEQQAIAPDPASASFVQHLRAFHQGLSPEEQQLLEQVLLLAFAAAAGPDQEIEGYSQFAPGAGIGTMQALITQIGLPALDAASKDAAKMTVKFAPEYTRTHAKTGNP
jgi:hypothetical protein